MRILVAGASGQVAHALASLDAPDVTVRALGRPGLDITVPDTIARAIAEHAPDVVVNAAAYTAVDKAESEPDVAFAINRDGAGNVAEAAARANLPVIHISTDYVFDGEKSDPYVETDEPNPQNVYGSSKLAGEIVVAEAAPDHAILRTAWVYGPHGTNFAKTMLQLAADRDEVRVVADQYGTPTYVGYIANGIVAVAKAALTNDTNWRGTFHMVSAGETTWAGFARAIFDESHRHGGPFAKVLDIPTSEYPTPAQRPRMSVLSNEKFQTQFVTPMPMLQDGIISFINTLQLAGDIP